MSERPYFPEGKNVRARQATWKEKCVYSLEVMEPWAYALTWMSAGAEAA